MFWILFLLKKNDLLFKWAKGFSVTLKWTECVREVTLLMYLNGFVLTRRPQTSAFQNYHDVNVFAMLKSFHLLYGGAWMQPGDISAWFMHARLRVCASHFQRACVYKSVSLSVSLLRCSCFVPLIRGVQGLHGGLCKISFSCFAMKALLERNRRNSLKWRRARLNYSAFTINFCRLPLPCISTPPRTTEPAGSSWECWQFPARWALWPRGNTSGCGSMDLCVEFAT